MSVIGTSLNGVGKSLTAVVPLGEEASSAYKTLYEELWTAATPVEPLTPKAVSPSKESGNDAGDSALPPRGAQEGEPQEEQ